MVSARATQKLSGRAGRPKSRSGCVRCKKKRLKCDEQVPACGRCHRAGAVCDYAFTKLKPVNHDSYRELLPASTVSAPALVPASGPGQCGARPPLKMMLPQYSDLSTAEVFYLDIFRSRIAAGLLVGGYSPAFWNRTVLREMMLDPCIRDSVIALGALDRAREKYEGCNIRVPLFTLTASTNSMVPDHAQAIKYYNRALATLRNRILQAELDCSNHPPYRSMLIASMVFILFETLQGNSDSVNTLFSSAILALKDRLLCLSPSSSPSPSSTGEGPQQQYLPFTSQIAGSLDDDGVEDAEFFLPRIASLRGLCTPMHPVYPMGWANAVNVGFDPSKAPVPRPEYPHAIIVRLWDRFFATVSTWFIRAYRNTVFGPSPPSSPCSSRAGSEPPFGLQEEQHAVISHCNQWLEVIREKQKLHLHAVTYPQQQREALLLMEGAARICILFASGVLDATEQVWDSMAIPCLDVLNLIEGAIEGAQIFRVKRLVEDQILPALNCIVCKCRVPAVRQRGRSLFRRIVMSDGSSNSWENLNTLVRQEVVCAAEERERLPDGMVPVTSRYWWITSSWDSKYTKMVIVNRRIGTELDEHTILTRQEFDELASGDRRQERVGNYDGSRGGRGVMKPGVTIPIRSAALA